MDSREQPLIQLLASERVNDAWNDARISNEDFRNSEQHKMKIEEQLSILEIDEDVRRLISDYISVNNRCWSNVCSTIYQYGFQDSLALARNKEDIETRLMQKVMDQ